VVVRPGGGLVPPAPGGPAQPERQACRGEQPGRPVGGQGGEPGGLGDRQLDQAGPVRAGLAGVGGDGRVAEGDAQVSVVHVSVGVAVAMGAGAGAGIRGRQVGQTAQGVADGGLPEPGERGQRGVPAGGVPGLTWDWSQASRSFPVLNVSYTASGAR